MDIKNLVLTDEAMSVIESGAWVRNLPGAPGLGLFVTGTGAKAFQKAMMDKHGEFRRENKGEPVTDEQHTEATRHAMAHVGLKDWDGITDDGKPVPYTKEQAIQWLTSKNGERLMGLSIIAAQRIDADAQSFVETIAKN